MFITSLYCILIVALLVQFLFYLFFFKSFLHKEKNKAISYKKPISIIIYIKNNENDLKLNLPSIIDQEYDDFEIILINHSSTDNSLNLIKDFQKKHSNIKLVNVENKEVFWGNKKYALTLGIKASSNDFLLFTDIKCKPLSKLWIKEMASKLITHSDIVIGYKSIKSNILIQFYNTITSLKSFTFAKLNLPYKGYSENLAYSKQLFFETKGFINHMNILNGECDLFLKDTIETATVKVQIAPQSHVKKQHSRGFSNFLTILREHQTLRSFYSKKIKFILKFFDITKLFFWSLSFYFCYFDPIFSLTIISFYLFFQYAFMSRYMLKTKESKLLYFLPILDLSYILFVFFTRVSNLMLKPKI